MSRNSKTPIYLAVFASGRGSNLQSIIDSIEHGKLNARIRIVLSNNSNAGALERAKKYGIPAVHLSHKMFETESEFENHLLKLLSDLDVELICLAGYMKKLGLKTIETYRNRIINIHPALLPLFGGKGMYGMAVHEAVIKSGMKITGVSVHLCDEEYDTGAIITQRAIPLNEEDTPDSLAKRVLQVEHQLYPETIQLFAENRVHIEDRKVKILPPL
ncbi:MAG: phosphoribosylglycinamide formyltransferase [Candidatus Schekmanbacteria bacterium RBG_13_48_7]|uniref:Phosphoribosylglycinamide formyltransferase n=1 Tax=Candidatus Schekmanbacteria bacterium RBG_13_48_7 TaxID=1817878 RepID=A0A1F7RJP6_9BACT|nr:MAG: phosphoribosylglycinamide formyltransferase [Candidatus Schekmanbacteria bacterium RBG_13_48_7]